MNTVDNSSLIWLLGLAIGILGYFLKSYAEKLKQTEETARINANKITALEVNLANLQDKIRSIEKRING